MSDIKPALEWFPDAPTQCPCCGAELEQHTDETDEDHEAWQYDCGLSLGRGVHIPFTAFDDCNLATSVAVDKYNQKLLVQRMPQATVQPEGE